MTRNYLGTAAAVVILMLLLTALMPEKEAAKTEQEAVETEHAVGIPMDRYRAEMAEAAREEARLSAAGSGYTQNKLALSEESRTMMLKITMAEAGGEDLIGKCLVMNVIINRVRSREFPNTIAEVIFQEGQFSPISDGRYYDMEPDEECYEALKMVENGWDRSKGATYFRTDVPEENWHTSNLTKLFVHGHHAFFKEQ